MSELSVSERAGVCPRCAHPATTRRRIGLLARLGILRPRAASCVAPDENDASGWGEDCGCSHPFHGS